MSATLAGPSRCELRKEDFFEENDVQAHVWGLLSALYPQGRVTERRGQRRYPFPYLVRLTPVAADGVSPMGPSIVVAGKHLSEKGLGFYHPKPLAYRRMIASLGVGGMERVGLVLDVTWCRFTEQGWYESGGRFLGTVTAPSEPDGI